MEPVRPLRDVFADLAGSDAAQARAALAAAGHDLSDDLLRTAIDGYAGTAPAEVAEHLATADGADDGLALLASAPAGPWDAEVVLDPGDDLAADDLVDDDLVDDDLAGDDLAGDDLDAADLLDVPPALTDVHAVADPADHLTDDAPADHAFGAGDADDAFAPDDLDDLDDLDRADGFGAPAAGPDAPAAGHPVDAHGADADLGFDDGFGAGSPLDDLTADLADDGPDDGPDAQAHDVDDVG